MTAILSTTTRTSCCVLLGVFGTFVNGRGANVVHGLAIVVSRLCRLCARRPVGLHGCLPSLGSCARRVPDVPRGSPFHLRRPRTARRGCAVLVLRARSPTASSSMKIERRFTRRMARRVQPRESGCPTHKKAVAPRPRRLGASTEEGQPGATRP